MAEVHFTSHLRNLGPGGPIAAAGVTVGEALANLLAIQPHVRSYVLGDQGGLRKHVCIFADHAALGRFGRLYSSTIMPSSAESNGISARRASISSLI